MSARSAAGPSATPARERLVAAARELLWDRGFAATSPGAVQRAAEVGQGSMYHHFAGKEDLARTALARSAEEMRAVVRADLDGDGTAVDRITAYLRRERDVLRGCRFGRLAHDPEVLRSPGLRGQVAEMFGWLHAELTRVLEDGVAEGELPAELSPARLARTVAATLQGGYVLARASDDPTAFEDAVDGVLDLLHLATVPHPRGPRP